MNRMAMMLSAALLPAVLFGPASAQQPQAPLKIGVLADFSSVYSDIGGQGNVEATKMAIEEFGGHDVRQADRGRHRRRAEQGRRRRRASRANGTGTRTST